MTLLSEYGFNEGSGTTVADSSGNGRNLTASGSPWVTGHSGGGGHATITGLPGPNLTMPAFTVMCWVKVDTAPGAGNYAGIVNGWSTGGGNNDFWLEVNGANGSMAFDCNVGDQGAGQTTAESAASYSTGAWHHVAVAGTGTTITLFVDGTSVATGTKTTGSPNFGVASWSVGAYTDTTGVLAGAVDDLRFFDAALDAATITTWMNTPVGGGTVTVTGTRTALALEPRGGAASPEIAAVGARTALAVEARDGLVLADIGVAGSRAALAMEARSGVGASDVTVAATRTALAVEGRTGSAVVVSTLWIQSVDSSGRFMKDQNGSPILVRGASYWPAVALVPTSDINTLYSALAAAGHNACILDAVGGVGVNVAASGQTYDGVAPFVSGDITQFNSTYWTRVDAHVTAAQAAGITLWMLPIDHYAVADSGVFSGKSATDCQTYGANLATRYAAATNIVWFFGNDYSPTTGEDNQAGGVLAGIRSTGDARPATIMLNAPALSTDATYWESRSQINTVYTVYVQYQKVAAGYNRTPGSRDPRPAIFTEGRYELDSWYTISGEPNPNTPIIRQQELWALTSGSPGGFYGNDDWRFATGWQSRLGTYAGEQQLKKLRNLIAGLSWWKLRPDGGSFVTAGRGTQITDDSAVYPWQNDYVTAATAADGTLAVAYVPTNVGNTNARTITLDLTQVGSSNRTALWVDPTDATSTQTATITSNQVTTPAAHADGTRDWLLVIQADPITVTVTGTRTSLAVEARTGVALPDIGVTGTRTALAVEARTGSALPDIGVAGTRTALAVEARDGAAAVDITVTGSRTALAAEGRDGSAVAGIVAVGSGTAAAIEGRSGTVVADVAVAGTSTAAAVEARNGGVAVDVTVAGTGTGVALSARSGATSVDITVTGSGTAVTITARTGDVVVSATLVPGTGTSIALSARTGNVGADIVVAGARSAASVQVRTGQARTFAGYTAARNARARIRSNDSTARIRP